MMGKTHMVFGMATAIGAGTLLGWNTPTLSNALYYGSALVGSLLPDIDHPNSMAGRKSLGLAHIINKVAGHRGMTHYAITALGVGLTTVILSHSAPLSLGLFIGYGSHIIGDMMTKSGVPVLGPFDKKSYRFPFTFRTGKSWAEIAIFGICLYLIFVYHWWHL